jgi:hypothetical protein
MMTLAWLTLTGAETARGDTAIASGKPIDLHAVGVTITIPNGWVALDLTRHTVDQLLRSAAKEHGPSDKTAAAFLKKDEKLLSKSLVLYACKPRGDTCYDNVVITSLAGTPGPTVGHEAEIRAAYEANGTSRDVTVADTVVDGTPAVQVLSQAIAVARSGKIVHGTAYVVPGRIGAVEIDFTTDNDGRQNADVQRMLGSIKLST